jgi:hypothetical protein
MKRIETIECPFDVRENARLRALLRKTYDQAGHAEGCRWRLTYPIGPEADLCNCYRGELARELGVWHWRDR